MKEHAKFFRKTLLALVLLLVGACTVQKVRYLEPLKSKDYYYKKDHCSNFQLNSLAYQIGHLEFYIYVKPIHVDSGTFDLSISFKMLNDATFSFLSDKISIKKNPYEEDIVLSFDGIKGGGEIVRGKHQNERYFQPKETIKYRSVVNGKDSLKLQNHYSLFGGKLNHISINSNTLEMNLKLPDFLLNGEQKSIPEIEYRLKKDKTLQLINC